MTKRSYTKKKKSIKDKDSNDIPYTKVRVEWVDCVSDSAWASEKEFKNMKLASPVNEGWIFSKDRKSIKLFASYDKEDDGTITFGDRTNGGINVCPPQTAHIILYCRSYTVIVIPQRSKGLFLREVVFLPNRASSDLRKI